MPKLDPNTKYEHVLPQKNLRHTPKPVDRAFPNICIVCHQHIKPAE
jgi:hypothetical protein